MPYGIKQEIVDKINRILAEHTDIEEAILYGSRAKGNYTTGSDIDLTIKGDNLDLYKLNKISNDIEELFLPYTLDLSIFSHISNPDLMAHINRVGKIFYKRKDIRNHRTADSTEKEVK